MALLLAEGFDTRTAMASGIWTAEANGYVATFVAGRNGGYAMRSTSTGAANGCGIRRSIPATTTLVFGCAVRWGTTGGTASWGPIALYSVGAGVLFLSISPAGVVRVYRGAVNSDSSVLLGTTSVSLPTDSVTWQYVEAKIVAGTGTAGSVTIRQNGAQTLSVTGISTGATSYDGFAVRAAGAGTSAAWQYGTLACLDDVYVCSTTGSVNNDFLGDVKVYGLWPNGNGASSGLTGSDGDSTDNYLLVDDATAGAPDTADYVGSATVGAKDTYTYTDVPAAAILKGVQIDAYAAKSDAGAISGRNVAFDGTTTVTGADAALGTSYTGVTTIMETAPDGGAWTDTKVNAAQFGWEVRS